MTSEALYRQCQGCGRLLRCIVGTVIACPHCGREMTARLEIGADRIVGIVIPTAEQEPLWGQQLGAFDADYQPRYMDAHSSSDREHTGSFRTCCPNE